MNSARLLLISTHTSGFALTSQLQRQAARASTQVGHHSTNRYGICVAASVSLPVPVLTLTLLTQWTQTAICCRAFPRSTMHLRHQTTPRSTRQFRDGQIATLQSTRAALPPWAVRHDRLHNQLRSCLESNTCSLHCLLTDKGVETTYLRRTGPVTHTRILKDGHKETIFQ